MRRRIAVTIAAVLWAAGCSLVPPDPIVDVGGAARGQYAEDVAACRTEADAAARGFGTIPIDGFPNAMMRAGARFGGIDDPVAFAIAGPINDAIEREMNVDRMVPTLQALCLEERGYTVLNREEVQVTPANLLCAKFRYLMGAIGGADVPRCIDAVQRREREKGLKPGKPITLPP